MATYREQIMLALVGALSAGGGPAGLTIHRERTRPIEIDSLPAIMVYAEDDTPKPLAGQQYRAPLTERQLTVAAQIRAAGNASTPPDTAIDPILIWLYQRVGADETFGGLANGVEEVRTVWNSKEGDIPLAACTVHFTIKYRTSRLDPTSKG
jgi:hypothetical protein